MRQQADISKLRPGDPIIINHAGNDEGCTVIETPIKEDLGWTLVIRGASGKRTVFVPHAGRQFMIYEEKNGSGV